MLYFKTNPFPENLTQQQVEKSLRRYALKRTSSIDFKNCTYNIGMEQLFLGRERKKDLQFTRIKTSFEVLLPKMIIKLSKNPDAKDYKIRLSAVPLGVAIVLCFGIAANLILIVKGQASIDALVSISIPVLVFIGLISFELKLITNRVNKAITSYLKETATKIATI